MSCLLGWKGLLGIRERSVYQKGMAHSAVMRSRSCEETRRVASRFQTLRRRLGLTGYAPRDRFNLRFDKIRPSLQYAALLVGIARLLSCAGDFSAGARQGHFNCLGRLPHFQQMGCGGTTKVVQDEVLDFEPKR